MSDHVQRGAAPEVDAVDESRLRAFTNTVVGADRDLADQLDPFDSPTHHQVESDGARRPLVDGEQSGPVLRLRVEGDSVLIDGRRVRQPRSVCEHDVDGDGGGGISVAHIGLRVVEAGKDREP